MNGVVAPFPAPQLVVALTLRDFHYCSHSSTMTTATAEPSRIVTDGGVETTTMSTPRYYRLFLFQTLNEAQSLHGSSLLSSSLSSSSVHHQQDGYYYAHYHKFCTAKLHRVRHRHPDARPLLVHNAKYAPGVSGSGKRQHAYCPRAKDHVIIVSDECWWNWIFQAERAWAHACELQQQQQQQRDTISTNKTSTTKTSSSRRRQQAVKRLKKAVHWANKLVQHATATTTDDKVEEDGTGEEAPNGSSDAQQTAPSSTKYVVSPETILECQSYAAWMQGNLDLEQKRYLSAFRSYHTSMQLLLDLAEGKSHHSTPHDGNGERGNVEDDKVDKEEDDNNNTTPMENSSPASLARQDVWTTRAESLLRPLVRFCGYEAQDAMDDDDARIWQQLVSGHTTKAVNTNTTTTSESKSGKPSGAIILSFRNQSVALDGYQEIAVLFLKVEEQLQSAAVLQEDAFLSLTTNLDDAIRLIQTESKHYESLPAGPAVQAKRDELQTIRRYFEYQKLNVWRKQQEGRLASTHDESDLLHVYDTLLKNAVAVAELQESQDRQDDPLWLEAQAHVLRFRAFRCHYLARYYEEVDQVRQAMALFGQARKLVDRAKEEVAACDGQENYLVDLEHLSLLIRASVCRMEAKAFLAQGGSHSVGSSNRPLWMRIKDWDDGHGIIADNPPLPIPIPPKPIFYDIAWQLVPRPDVTQELADYIATHEAKLGFFDWLRGRR